MITPTRDPALEKLVFVNNTFDIDVLNETYRQLLCENFFKLSNLQKSSLGIKIFNLHISDFKKNLKLPSNSDMDKCRGKYAIQLNYEFIKPSIKLAYYNQPIFNKVMSVKDISKNKKLYKNNVLVFINGVLTTQVLVFPDNSHTYVILDYVTLNLDNESSIPSDAEVTVAFLPNYTMGELTTNQATIESGKGSLDISRFDNPKNLTANSLLFCSLGVDTTLKDFIPFTINNTKFTITIPTSFTSNKRVLTYITFNNDVMSDKFILSATQARRLTKDCPIPVDNILSFSVGSNGRSKHNSKLLRLYYPDVYRNTDDKSMNCFVFYNKNLVAKTYANDLELYFKFKANLLQEYSSGNILEIVRDYQPLEIDYSISDYEDSLYIPSVLSYKINTMQNYIDLDPNILTKYLSLKTSSSNKFLISIRNQNMVGKERNNTYSDGVVDGNKEFKEVHYVFPIPKSLLDLDIHEMRIYIDGYIQFDQEYTIKRSNDMVLIYVPKRLLPRRAIMEIERFFRHNFNTLIEFSETRNFVDVDFTNISSRPCAHDIILVDSVTNKFIPREHYRIVVYNSSINGYLNVPSTSFKEIPSKFKVVMDNPVYYDKKIMIMTNNQSHMVQIESDSPVSTYENISICNYDNEKDTFRVFKNGRLLPRFAYQVSIDDVLNKIGYINLKTTINAGDKLIIDKIPITYENVLYIDKIDNKRGLVDLHNKIDKPLNLKWYDIYLDGVRLNSTNVFLISPTKCIIHDVIGLEHLYICEKNRDAEVLKLQMDHDWTIIDKLFDADSEFKQEVLDQYPDIEDIIEDLIEEPIDDFDDFLDFFYNVMKYTYINPNVHQIPDDLKGLYTEIDDNAVLNLDPNVCPDAKIIYNVNPNEIGGIIV